MARALLVDDNPDALEALTAVVEHEGFETSCAGTLAEARAAVRETLPEVILLDLKLPDGDGMALFDELGEDTRPDVVLITGHASVDTAVAALRERVTDYLVKPVDLERLRSILRHILRNRDLREEIDELRRELRQLGRFGRFIGRSDAMQKVYDLIARVAPTDATVLVTGESGTGKELVARTIHELSERRHGPFRALNCGAMASELLESELFGHEKGAFTGADRRRSGYFEQAAGGTLFLDEITEMPADAQVRLLRVLESGELTRVGGETPIEVDARVVAATNRDPRAAVSESRLREDLYYRINVFSIDVPPLRRRDDDIELLARHFLEELDGDADPQTELTAEALDALAAYPWPGNVRELKNVVRSAHILADGMIGVADLPAEVTGGKVEVPSGGRVHLAPGTPLAKAEKQLILATLEDCDGNRTRAAKKLGISVKTLYNRLKAYEEQDE
jgi:DNA-binding NtrC family response regulator